MQNALPQERERRRGPWLILAAAVLFGTSGTAQALAPEGADPEVIGAVRLTIGGAFMILLAVAQGDQELRKRWQISAIVYAATCMAVMQICFFCGIARIGVALGTAIFIGSYPVFAGLLGLLIRKEHPDRRWMVATALAIFGCSLLVGSGNQGSIDVFGVVLALVAASAYAMYSVAVKGLLDRPPTVPVIAVVSSLAAVFLSPILFTANLAWLTQPSGIAVALYLGLASTAAPYYLFARGLRAVPVSTAATLNLAEPFTAGLLGVF